MTSELEKRVEERAEEIYRINYYTYCADNQDRLVGLWKRSSGYTKARYRKLSKAILIFEKETIYKEFSQFIFSGREDDKAFTFMINNLKEKLNQLQSELKMLRGE